MITGLFGAQWRIYFAADRIQLNPKKIKILKTIGLVIVGLILIMIATFSVSTNMSYEKSVTINAPIEVVWENVNSLADLDKWSPWVATDSNVNDGIQSLARG